MKLIKNNYLFLIFFILLLSKNFLISLFIPHEKINIATNIIVRNNREIYFLIDGYNEKYRNIHSSHVLKWAIISKYYQKGYNFFNLGEIHEDYQNPKNKYYGMYLYKIGFGGKIVEYPPTLLLVINKTKYNTYLKLNRIISKKKSL